MGAVDGLEIRDLVVQYSSGGYAVRPIDGLNLSVPTGELVLLLGASGCGKTTLLSVLAAILSPTSGTVNVGEVPVTELSGRALREYRRHTVGIVFQAFNLIPSLSACENVQAPLRAAGVSGRSARSRARDLLEQFGLDDRTDHRPGDLSGGQQQRVAIARALVHDPPLLLADEPTAHLDYIQVDSVLQHLRRLAAPGRVVVVATHDERLLPLADRVVSLSPRSAAETSRPPVTLALGPGGIVFEQGDTGDLVYTVESGEVEIIRHRVEAVDEVVARVEPGSFFGELAPLFGLRRSATARAGPAGATVVGRTVTDFRSSVRPNSVGNAVSETIL